MIRPYRPGQLYRVARTLNAWGHGTAGGTTTLADRFRDETGLVDDLGSLTFGELHRRSNALARGLAHLGVSEGDPVGVLCRNHRYLVEVSIAVAKLGADVLYLNTSFSGPQVADVLAAEGAVGLVYDDEFEGHAASLPEHVERVLAWTGDAVTHPPVAGSETAPGLGSTRTTATCEDLVVSWPADDLTPPQRHSRTLILTSGTTGHPRGAARERGNIGAAVALLSGLPLRHRQVTHIAAPLFHTWGWAHFQLGMLLGSTLVLTRRFDPRGCLELMERHRCDSLIAIPVMLQRILTEAGPDSGAPTTYDLSALHVTAVSGSALTGELAQRWMDAFGDTLHNVYGSTEVAWVSIAGPADLRAAPGTAGHPPHGTKMQVLDDSGDVVPLGQTGRIFVRNSMLFEGYSGGGSKEMAGRLMATGDVGRLDADGRVFVEGRDDDMVVSGGEKVFPQEVEDCLAAHSAVADVAVVGVADEEFGQRLRAFVVRRPTESGVDSVSEADLQEHVRARLARYKVPREVAFVDELPRNATGKIMRRELPRD
ncbi:MAG: AMP-binding protein [Nocardioidaceae bacterium]